MIPHVLIIDDSVTVRMHLKESLEVAGFSTFLCATIESAREALLKNAFDIIILDVLLPDGDGLEFLRELKASPGGKATPVMLLSSEDEVSDRVRGMKTGADEYIGKPYDPGQVVSRARELLRRYVPHVREKPLILVIDDSVSFREALKEHLDLAGYETVFAGSGEEGLRHAVDLRADALIVDGILPGIDGIQVIQSIRADSALRRTPCLLLTASLERSEELRALKAGADLFVYKDEDMDVILAKLKVLFRTSPSSSLGVDSSLLGPKRVLAVDDSLTYLNELAEHLREEGYDVVSARSGEEALELLPVQTVDAILMDVVMPGLSGREVCQRIKSNSQWREIPLLMLTVLDEREALLEGINAGADDYITKSSQFDVLLARLRAQLRRRQFEDENRRFREELLKREMVALEMQAMSELAETRSTHIQELEKKNEELRLAKEAADALARELESFSYSVSHDLRGPLRHINGYIKLLQKEATALSDKSRRYLNVVSDSANRMADLIDDLLEFSRMGRAEMRMTTVDLDEMVHAVIASLQPDVGERKIAWNSTSLKQVEADPALLRQVFMNLLANAMKYTRRRNPAMIEIRRSDPPGEVVISVSDNGVGFDMKYVNKLFGVFQRLHTDEEFQGTGIGLANVARIIHRHGGRVWAEGIVDSGATFHFSLPSAE